MPWLSPVLPPLRHWAWLRRRQVGSMRSMDDLVQNRIVLDRAILAGKPVIRGTRLSVEFVISLLADGWSEADILDNYPGISHDDILACLAYAQDMLKHERVRVT